mmetsp:Transcript_30968/g.74477  ORF Transcript_30968/g.74477 Transcript_30968/m.74477 type:complete len:1005 (+) Transcript_30968:15-3029(+)
MVLQEVKKWHRKRRTKSNLRKWSKSATKIQSFVRGSLCRKRIHEEQERQNAAQKLRVENRKMRSKKGHKKSKKKKSKSSLKKLSKSATKIQAFVRGSFCRQKVRQQTIRRDSASTQIEAVARGFLCRNEHLQRPKNKERRRNNSNRSRRVDNDNDYGDDHSSVNPLQQSQTWQASAVHNLITVFQAAPLAWLDANEDPRRVKRLDLHFERETITNALIDSNVSVDFEIATDDRFGKFLAKGGGRAIHVSCHGKSTYLAFEDGWGQVQIMQASVLKDWISSGGRNLEFVFVSACDSWSIGKIFADAGVPHVVCCDKQTTLLDSAAAVKFTKALYQALAWGQPVQKAFELAQQELSVHPSLQASQFCLLPENGNHNVPIFSPDVEGAAPPISNPDTTQLPLTTDFFVRDDLEVYRTVQAIKERRIVRVMGAEGIGKETLVRECCQYLRDRQKVVNIEEIVWKSVTGDSYETADKSVLAMCFRTLFKQWRSRCARTVPIRECRRCIIRTFRDKKALLVIEAKHLDIRGAKKMLSFLNLLLQETNPLKLVVIYGAHTTPEVMGDLPGAFDISVDNLNIESTVKLFARLCKHVPNRVVPRVCDAGDLWRLLSQSNQSSGNLSKRSKRQAAILRQLGGSNPRDICNTASRITEDEFLALVELGTFHGLDLFATHTELVLLAFEFERRFSLRRAREDADGVVALDRKLRAVNLLMKEFQNAEKLASLMEEKLECLVQSENDEKELWLAKFAELQNVESLIRKEEEDIISWAIDAHSSLFNLRLRHEQITADEKLVYRDGSPCQDSGLSTMAMDLQISSEILKSKHGIESCIRLLEGYCRQNFNKAAAIQIHLSLLRELLHFKLKVSRLEALSCQLGAALCTFTTAKKWEQATVTDKLLDRFQFRIKREEIAKRQIKPGLTTRRGVIKISSYSRPRVPKPTITGPPPPPLYSDYTGISLVAKNRKRRNEVLSIVDRMLETLKSRPSGDSDESVSAATQATVPVSISSLSTGY